MKIYDFLDYKKFVLAELKTRPKGGHGQFQKIAQALNVHSTMVTHVFKAGLHLSPEQSLALADFLGLNELETEYFMNLVQLARAGDQRTKGFFERKISTLKEKSMNISERIGAKNSLDEKDQALFYSSWIYSAIRLLSAVPKFQNRSAIAEELNLPLLKINRALEFLISRGLCIESGNKIIYGDLKTYLPQDSPLVTRHHANWRAKVAAQLDRLSAHELMFTFPTVISEKDYPKIREEIIQFIEKFKKIAEPSSSERLYCLNIDWVEIKK